MGSARNLKLGAKAKAHEAIICVRVCVWVAQCRLLFSCCVHRKDVAGSRGRAPGRGLRAKPP